MLALKLSEQGFRSLDMIDVANKVNKAVESLEIAWSQSDAHEILNMSFYAIDVDATLNTKEENMSEQQLQQLSIDMRPVKALAERLRKQAEGQTKTITKGNR